MEDINITFKKIDVEKTAVIHSIKIMHTINGVELFYAHIENSNISGSLIPLSDPSGTQALFSLPIQFNTIPQWDIAAIDNGSFNLVYTNLHDTFGNLILVHIIKKDQLFTPDTREPIPKKFISGFFIYPKFVKRFKGEHIPISSIASISGQRKLALFSRKNSKEGYGKLADLYKECKATLIQYQNGFLLFYKDNISSLPKDSIRLNSLGNKLVSGTLKCVELDNKFSVIGSEIKPLGDIPIFEFDVDINDREAILFSTTLKGSILTTCDFSKSKFKNIPLLKDDKALLTTPCVLLNNGTVHIGFIKDGHTENREIVVGSF